MLSNLGKYPGCSEGPIVETRFCYSLLKGGSGGFKQKINLVEFKL